LGSGKDQAKTFLENPQQPRFAAKMESADLQQAHDTDSKEKKQKLKQDRKGTQDEQGYKTPTGKALDADLAIGK